MLTCMQALVSMMLHAFFQIQVQSIQLFKLPKPKPSCDSITILRNAHKINLFWRTTTGGTAKNTNKNNLSPLFTSIYSSINTIQ